MAKSSGHFAGGGGGLLLHNDRSNFSNSVVFFNEKNELINNHKKAFEIFRAELKKRSDKYKERLGQKLHSKALTHLSLICNLEQHHTLENIEPIVKHLEETLDTKVFQVAIHRDEGKLVHKTTGNTLFSGHTFFCNPSDKKLYFDNEYKKPINMADYDIEKNYHAHIEMMGIDSNGNGIKRNKLNKYYLSQFQTFLADTLQMERGVDYKKTNTPKVRHKSVDRFKEDGVLKNEIKQEYFAKIDNLQKELKTSKENEIDFEKIKEELAKNIDNIKAPIRKDILENFTKQTFELLVTNYPQILTQAVAQQTKEQLATLKDLKIENADLREQLQNSGAKRADYAELEQVNAVLKQKIKDKDLTIQDLEEKYQELRKKYENMDEFRKYDKETMDLKNEMRKNMVFDKDVHLYQLLKNNPQITENRELMEYFVSVNPFLFCLANDTLKRDEELQKMALVGNTNAYLLNAINPKILDPKIYFELARLGNHSPDILQSRLNQDEAKKEKELFLFMKQKFGIKQIKKEEDFDQYEEKIPKQFEQQLYDKIEVLKQKDLLEVLSKNTAKDEKIQELEEKNNRLLQKANQLSAEIKALQENATSNDKINDMWANLDKINANKNQDLDKNEDLQTKKENNFKF